VQHRVVGFGVDAVLAQNTGVLVLDSLRAADEGQPYFAWLPTPETANGPQQLARLQRIGSLGDTLRCDPESCVRPAISLHGRDTVVHLCDASRIGAAIGPPERCRPVGSWGAQGSYARALVGWGKADLAAEVNAAAPAAAFDAGSGRELEFSLFYTTDAQRVFVLQELERALRTAPWALTTQLRPRTPPHNRVIGLVAFRHSPVLRTKWEIVKVDAELDNPATTPQGHMARIVVSIDARNSAQNVRDAEGFVAASAADYAVYEAALARAITQHLAPRCERGADDRSLRCVR
jgi:hypothetical protein